MTARRFVTRLAAALGLLAALPAAAQSAAAQGALTVYGGYRGGGSLEQTIAATTTTDDIDAGAAFALAFEWAVDGARNGQLFASAQRTHLQLAPGSAQTSVPLTIAYLHLGGVNYFDGPAGHGAYVAGGLGATFMSPGGGLSSEVRPSMSLALGYEHALAPSVALRGELRGYATLINSGGGFFCSGGCVVSIHGDGMFQAEALLGLSMRF